ncbi:3'-5' exonuclease [Peptacetobacter sp.]|uniref:3'-5' exonuclease n=1 Tax=Peptacetobacter sp. TaxID=2991975 RepID=UPI00262EE6AA|nr:3'-5' exonuclease [Peptacetobacter sp.]
MEYIVFDLEFNQGFNRKSNKTFSDNSCPFEIIQLGAVKLDSNFNIIAAFDTFVKPCLYTSMHPYVSKITGISIEDLKNAPSFKEAFKNFTDFLSDKDSIFCVWGKSDLRELYRNITYHNLDSSKIPKSYIDVQYYASDFINNTTAQSIGLENAIIALNLQDNIPYHNALNDAYYTAKVFSAINPKNIKPNIYLYTNLSNKSPYGLDPLDDDIFQKECTSFEKKLKRNLSKEEKKILSMTQYIKKNISNDEILRRHNLKKKFKKHKKRDR